MYKVGIVGNGYVGGAIAHGFSPASTGNCEIKVYDIMPERSLNTLSETVNESDYVFVSVPTPMNKDGSISLKFIHEVFKNINGVNRRDDNIFLFLLIKSFIMFLSIFSYQNTISNLFPFKFLQYLKFSITCCSYSISQMTLFNFILKE